MKFRRSHRKFSDIDKEFIESIPKTIDPRTGCWIPIGLYKNSYGYIMLGMENRQYYLHRLVLSIYHGINYFDKSIQTRHSSECEKACFYWQHLTPGTPKENVGDMIRDGHQCNARKERCPSCNGEYRYRINRTGSNIGKANRYCKTCQNEGSLRSYYRRKQNENK
jgi:hypothetical protein